MIAIAMTIVICISAVTIVAMECSNKRFMVRDETITKEIMKSKVVQELMERNKSDV